MAVFKAFFARCETATASLKSQITDVFPLIERIVSSLPLYSPLSLSLFFFSFFFRGGGRRGRPRLNPRLSRAENWSILT